MLRLKILQSFKCNSLSDDRRFYLHARKLNVRSDVDGPTHTKQLLNLFCIVYLYVTSKACQSQLEDDRAIEIDGFHRYLYQGMLEG